MHIVRAFLQKLLTQIIHALIARKRLFIQPKQPFIFLSRSEFCELIAVFVRYFSNDHFQHKVGIDEKNPRVLCFTSNSALLC